MKTENLQHSADGIIDLASKYGLKAAGAIVVLIIGLYFIKLVVKVLGNGFDKSSLDPALKPYTINITNAVLKVMLIISVAGMAGIETSSFLALVGAAGLAIGLSLQGALANFAGGILILIFKPFVTGQLIEAQGHLGEVKDIQLFTTKIIDPQNRIIVMPNGKLANEDIKNYSELGLIRVDLNIGIAYDSDLKKAKDALMQVMKNNEKVLKKPAPFVGVEELADSAVNLAVRPYCKPKDYWDVYFDIYEQGKLALDAAGISIPFPQMDVMIKKD